MKVGYCCPGITTEKSDAYDVCTCHKNMLITIHTSYHTMLKNMKQEDQENLKTNTHLYETKQNTKI